jgi:anaerobic ribonucleoside-triphosphate reductase
MEKLKCWDCKKLLEKGDEYMSYKGDKEIYVKCKSCHQKDPILRNFQSTEVYSRVVGYIRPIKQWNRGKKAEFKDRRTFKIHAD